jgi:thymidylate synthase
MNTLYARNLKEGLKGIRKKLLDYGYIVETKTWQGKQNPPDFLEILHANLLVQMSETQEECSELLNALQPWASIHFQERISGIPYNPPPSHKMWLKNTEDFLSGNVFSHTYPERMWGNKNTKGIRFENANLDSAITLLKKDPYTRQCYIPMWFPEDLTAANLGERVPCSFGWHFIKRFNELHCSYHMRSCDAVRHLHNDLYFANSLALWINKEANLQCKMGTLHFSATSLHCFSNDKYTLNKLLK